MAYKTFCNHCDRRVDDVPQISVITIGLPPPHAGVTAQLCSVRCLRAWAGSLTEAEELPCIEPPKDAS